MPLTDLRPAFLQRLQLTLEQPPRFRTLDFDIDAASDDPTSVHVTIKHMSSEHAIVFQMRQNGSRMSISGAMSPGDMTKTETFNAVDVDVLIREIRRWLKNIQEDFNAAPAVRDFLEQMAAVQTTIDSILETVEEERAFTRAEAVQTAVRLDEIEAKLEAQIRAVSEAHARANESAAGTQRRLDNELDAMRAEIAFLKQQVATLTNKQWARAAIVHLYRWFSKPEHQALVANAVQEVTKLLPP